MLSSTQVLLQPLWDDRREFYALAEARGFGLEIVSFAMTAVINQPATREKHLATYREELGGFARRLTLHGPFIDLVPHSPDALVAEVARGRMEMALETAQELGCSHVVFHSGLNFMIQHPRYYTRAVEVQAEFWTSLLERFPTVTICVENLWEPGPEIFSQLLTRADHPRLRVCFDVGHANIFSVVPPAAWLDELGPAIAYMHWNDNEGDRDSELPPGSGNIDWDTLFRLVGNLDAEPMVTIEVGALSAVQQSLVFLEQRGMLERSPERDA